MADPVRIFEVGPRDGLQNEAARIPAADKIALVDMLSDTGLQAIEVTSFVSPKWVPQMADAAEVMAGIVRSDGVRYAALTPNVKGFERARAARASEVAVFASASEGFSQRNINCSVEDSLERFRPVLAAASDADMPVRGYVSCVTDCPYDGRVPPSQVVRVARELLAMGCYEVSLGDTIGAATPEALTALLQELTDQVPPERLAGHFHDTGGRALDNIDCALGFGLRVFDAAVGGLGGCPYAEGATGNVATERVVAMLDEKGHATGIDHGKLMLAAGFARGLKERAA